MGSNSESSRGGVGKRAISTRGRNGEVEGGRDKKEFTFSVFSEVGELGNEAR